MTASAAPLLAIAMASFALLLAVAYLIARPFVAPVRFAEEAPLTQLHADRDRLRAQLRELDMDFETGKLANDEYEKLRARRLQQIEATTRAIRDVGPAGEEVLDEASAPSDALDAQVERRIAERRRLLEELERRTCPGCGTAIDPNDRFCRRCGADLPTVAETTR